jgi:hypothetical protein
MGAYIGKQEMHAEYLMKYLRILSITRWKEIGKEILKWTGQKGVTHDRVRIIVADRTKTGCRDVNQIRYQFLWFVPLTRYGVRNVELLGCVVN